MKTVEILGSSPEGQIYERFPGISCAYRDAAGREILKYNGIADKEDNIPVDGNTVFPACSISKFVTALTVMKLQEQDLLTNKNPGVDQTESGLEQYLNSRNS